MVSVPKLATPSQVKVSIPKVTSPINSKMPKMNTKISTPKIGTVKMPAMKATATKAPKFTASKASVKSNAMPKSSKTTFLKDQFGKMVASKQYK